jgi:hypothetical protein
MSAPGVVALDRLSERLLAALPELRVAVASTEADFDLVVEPRGAVAEAGRLVITPEHRGDPAHRTWGALFGRAWLMLRAHGLAVLAGAAGPPMIERLRALGLPFEILGPARAHWGEERHPVRLDPAAGDPRWYGDR